MTGDDCVFVCIQTHGFLANKLILWSEVCVFVCSIFQFVYWFCGDVQNSFFDDCLYVCTCANLYFIYFGPTLQFVETRLNSRCPCSCFWQDLVYLFILTIFYATEAHFCIEVLFPPGTARWLHSTLMESKTRLVRDVFDTFATHAEFFVTSLVQTAGHKIGKFTVLLLLFSNVDI